MLKKVPMAMCGLILGMEALGNLLIMSNFIFLGNLFGIIGMLLMLIILAKITISFTSAYQELLNPLAAGTLPTFTMALMLISMYWSRWGFSRFAFILWSIAIVCHIAIMLAFCQINFITKKPQLEDVYPSWFVMFVGIGVIPVSAKLFSISVGQIFFYIALGLYIIVFPIVFFRLYKNRELAEGALPLLTIIAAPASLCLTGYLNSFTNINQIFAIILGLFAQFLYISTIVLMVKIYVSAKHSILSFKPSFAAFTFPLVISATGLTVLLDRLQNHSALLIITKVELIIAFIMVTYVLVHYLRFLILLVKNNFSLFTQVEENKEEQD